MSANPEAAAFPVGAIVRRAFGAIRQDVPEAYRKFQRCAPPVIALVLDGEAISVINVQKGEGEREGEGVVVSPTGEERGDVSLRLRVATLLALIDGRTTVLDALDEGSLVAIGPSEALAATHDAVVAFLQGAVRSPRTPVLLDELRAHGSASVTRSSPGREAA